MPFIIMLLASIVLTILVFFFVMPARKDGTFGNPFLQFVHNYFNFKKIYIESVLKFIFVFMTLLCILGGFAVIVSPLFIEHMDSDFIGVFIIGGLLLMTAGPVLMRLLYEGMMMSILQLKNVVDINNKIPNPKAGAPRPAAPRAAAPQPAPQAPAYQQQSAYQQSGYQQQGGYQQTGYQQPSAYQQQSGYQQGGYKPRHGSSDENYR